MGSDARTLEDVEREMVAYILSLVEKGKQIERQERALAKGISISEVVDEEPDTIVIELRGKI